MSETKHTNQPTHTVRIRHGYGKQARYETIGAAWTGKDQSFYVKLNGTQLVSEGFSLYPIIPKETPTSRALPRRAWSSDQVRLVSLLTRDRSHRIRTYLLLLRAVASLSSVLVGAALNSRFCTSMAASTSPRSISIWVIAVASRNNSSNTSRS